MTSIPDPTFAARWRKKQAAAQAFTLEWISGKDYQRIKYGEEVGKPTFSSCPDCGVKEGEIHVPDCDQEQCARCHTQRVSCNCER